MSKIPTSVQHAALLLAAALLGWAAQVLPGLHLTGVVGTLAGAVVTFAVAWLTPLVKSYGLFAAKTDTAPPEGTASATVR